MKAITKYFTLKMIQKKIVLDLAGMSEYGCTLTYANCKIAARAA
jgi:hypothetical protein